MYATGSNATVSFRFGGGEFTVPAQVLEPAHEITGEADELHPGAVGVEVGEREPFEPGVLQAIDVVDRVFLMCRHIARR